ncbi:hypothetical protein WG66_012572, partial [Moniliophthora roreri]
EEHGTVASGIVESMFAEDLAIFPASRSEVIQNEDQLHQVEQADETETETVIVTAGDAEGFEMIARDQGSSDTETEDSESRKGTDDAEKAIESVDECAEVQQEKPNTEGALSENPASSLVEPTSQATTESEPACATRRSNEDAKPDSRRESPILHVPSSSSGAVLNHEETEDDGHGPIDVDKEIHQSIPLSIVSTLIYGSNVWNVGVVFEIWARFYGVGGNSIRSSTYLDPHPPPCNMTQELASANEATKPVSASEYTPNRYFFLQPVIFQVDNELFQIPDTLFPASETFKKLYPAILEGNTPVVLRDCTKRQFEAFLIIVLQPHSHMFNGKHPCNYPPLLEFLLPAFELAKKWGFHQLALDIGHQAGLLMSSPVQKVAVGHRYAVLPWYRSGLEELVTSDDDITLEDAGEIGFPLALRLYHARARYARSMRDRRDEEHGTVASGIVESMFAEDLAIFPASRSEVIESEDQPHQVGQTDETDTETVMVTPGDDESFEMVAQQEHTDNEAIPEDQMPTPTACPAAQVSEPANEVQTKDDAKTNLPLPTGPLNVATAQSSSLDTSDSTTNVSTQPQSVPASPKVTNEVTRELLRAVIDQTGAQKAMWREETMHEMLSEQCPGDHWE